MEITMNSVKTKIPAMIGLGINTLVFIGFGIMMILFSFEIFPINQGLGITLLGFDLIFTLLALFLYFIDGILAAIRACFNIDSKLNIALSLTVFAEVGVSFIIANKAAMHNITNTELVLILWFLLYLAILVLEIITVIRNIILQKKEKTKCTLST